MLLVSYRRGHITISCVYFNFRPVVPKVRGAPPPWGAQEILKGDARGVQRKNAFAFSNFQ
jgi:hypothetical protein